MKRSKELSSKKIISEYSFVKIDLEYKRSVLEENQKEFFSRVYENHTPKNQIENSKTKKKKEKFNWELLGNGIKNKVKGIYREISKLVHPDKDPNRIYKDIFNKSVEAYKEGKLMDLYEICDKLEITYDISDEEIPIIESEILQKKEDISAIENSIIYIWSQSGGDEKKRKELIDQFIEITKNKL